MAVQIVSSDLRWWVTVEKLRADNETDAFGHVDEKDKAKNFPLLRRRAKVVATGGREVRLGEQLKILRTWRVWIRQDMQTRKISGRQRLRIEEPVNVIANIETAFDPNGDGRWLQLECIEEISEG